MRDFKIRKINQYKDKPKFDVEIEFEDNGNRETHSFPTGNNWEKLVDDVPKFVHEIQKRVYNREQIIGKKVKSLKSFEGYEVNFKDYKK